MTDIEKEEMSMCVHEDLMEVLAMLEAPSRRAGVADEWACLMDAAQDYKEALEEIL